MKLNQFFRLIKLTGPLLRFDLADDLLEEFDGFEAALSFITFDVKLDLAIGGDGDFKFALFHRE
jgi:hypothetical protein